MAFSITVRLRQGRYEADGQSVGRAEWPPHPARLFCALVASCGEGPRLSGLEWLEALAPPEVWADPDSRVHLGRASGFVVRNAIEPKGGGSLAWPGRTNGKRVRGFAVPSTESFAVVYPEAVPPPGVLAELRELARLVPYVGRSTSLAEVTVDASLPSFRPGHVVFELAELSGGPGTIAVRVPYPGYAAALEAAYLDGRRSWEAARTVAYQIREETADRTASPRLAWGPFEDLMVWALERPTARIGGDDTATITAAFRRAVLSRVSDPIPAQVSGHGAEKKPHVGFLAVPDVSHRHADGHILALALAIPRDLPPADLASLLQGVLVRPMTELRLPGGRNLAIRYGPDRPSLRPDRWSAPSREWVTVNPLMLDGYLRRGRTEEGEVARTVEMAGYPRPVAVETSPSPLISGAVWRPRRSSLPPGRTDRRLLHARIVFDMPVTGPVIAGAMRYLGLGLFLPVGARQPDATVEDRLLMEAAQ